MENKYVIEGKNIRKMYGKFREMDVPMKRWLKLA